MIFVAGHRGMVGSAILRKLKKNPKNKILIRTRGQLDLTNQNKVFNFFKKTKPSQVYLAAAKVGGIYANNFYPAEFIYSNLVIQTNVIHAAFLSGVKKLLFIGSSCIYPSNAKQPMSEKSLLTGLLEKTNEPYAISKIAGIKLCESYNRQYGKSHKIDYRSVMPTNLYGSGDNYHETNSHVIPALIRKIHEAKIKNHFKIDVWGSGKPRREFLYVDDLADACIHVMNLNEKTYYDNVKPMLSHINIGYGKDLTIKELVELICEIIGFKGDINYDKTKPDGTFQKLMDSSLVNLLGWKPTTSLRDGLKKTYLQYLNSLSNSTLRN